MKLSDIHRIGVAGGGTMGFGIAFNFAFWGYPTVVYDLNDEILEKSAQRVKKAFDIFVTEGLIGRTRAEESFKRLTFTSDMACLANCDFFSRRLSRDFQISRNFLLNWTSSAHLRRLSPVTPRGLL